MIFCPGYLGLAIRGNLFAEKSKMRGVALFVSLSAVVAGGLAQSSGATFEAPDFNVTEALVDAGVNVSDIPELAGLAQRSSLGACKIAVSYAAVS